MYISETQPMDTKRMIATTPRVPKAIRKAARDAEDTGLEPAQVRRLAIRELLLFHQ